MKYCSYCGNKLENGKRCSCENAQKHQRKFRTVLISIAAGCVFFAIAIAIFFSTKADIDLNDYLVVEEVSGQNGHGIVTYGLDADGLRDAILGTHTDNEASSNDPELAVLESLQNNLEIESILACITVTATNETELSNGDVVTITAAFKNDKGYKISQRFKNAVQTITVSGLEDQLPPAHKQPGEADQQEQENKSDAVAEARVIELSSAEDLYALGRIFSHTRVKNSFLSTFSPYVFADDLAAFAYPEEITAVTDKVEYLRTASYLLKEDIELTLQVTDGKDYFTGLGSEHYPFGGKFDGGGHTITLVSKGDLLLNENTSYEIGLFSYTNGANITNINVEVKNNIVVTECISSQKLRAGVMFGRALNTTIENCSVSLRNAMIGADFASSEKSCISHIGGFAGESELSTFTNCTVEMEDSSVMAKGKNVSFGNMYATLSVGGFLGFSNPGSDNKVNIGRVGNQLHNCKVISKNTTQRDIIWAAADNGDELAVGGLIGCSFNNLVAKDCLVEVTKGNVTAIKAADKDTGMYGTQVGGIIGRLEHTGELYNCSVIGNYLNITSKSANNYTYNGTNAGGIAGYSMGPYHRNITPLNGCSFDGRGTSTISVENMNPEGKALVGGIAGYANYKAINCSVKDTTILNKSINTNNCAAGKLFGWFSSNAGLWTKGEFFSPDESEITDCNSENVILGVSNNVSTNETY